MCAGIPKGKSSNITSVDSFEGVKGLNVTVSIERCAKGEGGEGHEAQAQVVSYVAANNLITLVLFASLAVRCVPILIRNSIKS